MFSLTIFVGILLFFQARSKGYNPWLWVYAGSLFGYAVLSFLPSTNDFLGRETERVKILKKRGNIIDTVLTVLTILFDIGMVIFIFGVVWSVPE